MGRTDVASRVVAAPPEQVFAALLDRDALMAWLPPKGMTARFEQFDPTPGGSYRLVLTYADGSGAPGKARPTPTSSRLGTSTSFPTTGSFRPSTSSPTTLPSPAR